MLLKMLNGMICHESGIDGLLSFMSLCLSRPLIQVSTIKGTTNLECFLALRTLRPHLFNSQQSACLRGFLACVLVWLVPGLVDSQLKDCRGKQGVVRGEQRGVLRCPRLRVGRACLGALTGGWLCRERE